MCSGAFDLAATGIDIYESEQQRKAGKEAMRINRRIAMSNAELSERRAEETRQAGHQAEGRMRSKQRALMSEQRAGYAASGLRVTSGSAAHTVKETQRIGNVDALMLRENFRRQQEALETEGEQYRLQAKLIGSQRFSSLGSWAKGLSGLARASGSFGF